MCPAATPVDRPGTDARAEGVRTLAEQLPRFLRLAHAIKTQLSTTDNRDRADLVLLFPLARLGPLRQGALAEVVHADPSTVSRHVAVLVDQGLVRRVADSADGRATRLVVTDAGSKALDALRAEHEARLDRVTAQWDPADLATFTALFGRLLDDLAATLPGVETGASCDPPRANR